MDVEFGLSFSATGGVVMAGVAGEASLRVTLGYDVSRRLVTGQVETANEVEPAAIDRLSASWPGPRDDQFRYSGQARPGYLGRILDEDAVPVGTCFRAASGLLVTACQVLDEMGVAEVGAAVSVDPLAGESVYSAGTEG